MSRAGLSGALVVVGLLTGCSGTSDRVGKAPEETGPAVGTPAGTPATALQMLWTAVSQDDVATGLPDLHHPTHSRADDGSMLILWDEQTANSHFVSTRAYGPDLEPLGESTNVATIGGIYARPDGTPVADGYVATWHTRYDVFLRRIAPDGTPLGEELLVNEARGVDPDKGQPDVATLTDGTVVVVYHFSTPGNDPVSSYYWRRYSPLLEPLSGEELVGTSSAAVGSPPDVVALAGGGFAVGWSTRTPTGGTIELTWFDAEGQQLRKVRADAESPDRTPSRPNLAVQPDDTLALTWRVQTNAGDGLGAWGRIYTPAGDPRTDPFELQIESQRPSVAAGPGFFLFLWEPPVSTHVKAQSRGLDGESLEEAWNPFDGGNDTQHRPEASFTADGDGSYTVVFTADRGDTGSRSLARAIWRLE